jgi:succinoglycan biosynthesis protein ExoO
MTGALPRFTVVIPLYNKRPHVERAIRSVLDQDYAAAEIIVVDDASTDGGDEIAEAIKGVQILRRGEPGPGGYAARNFGIRAAMCEWVAFLDADDQWRRDHLSSLANAISAAGPDVGCAFTRPVFVAQDVTRPYPISRALESGSGQLSLGDFVAAWLDAKTCPMWTGAVAIKRSVLLAAGGFPADSASRGGDKDLWLRVMALTNAVFVPNVTAAFHQDTVNRVTHSLDHSAQPVVCRSITRMLPSAEPDTGRLLKQLNNMEVAYYARYAAGAGAPFQPEALKHLRGPALAPTLTIIGFGIVGRIIRLLRSRRSKRSGSSRTPVMKSLGTAAATSYAGANLSAVPHRSMAGVLQKRTVPLGPGINGNRELVRRSA